MLKKALSHRRIFQVTSAFLIAAGILLSLTGAVFAQKLENLYTSQNEETGYYGVICDQAGLLTEEEEVQLEEYLDRMTEYCSAIFLTSSEDHSSSMRTFSEEMMEKIGRSVGMTDGYKCIIFVIDMDQREMYIFAGREARKVITTSIANSITDNTYTYATDGNYFRAARETFDQIYRVYDGQAIAQPMKYITTALLAIFVGLGISLIMVRSKTKRKKADENSIMDALAVHQFDPVVNCIQVSERRVRHVESSGGGGGGGGFSGGGGGGGGGGFSGGGGGGGHSF